MALTYFLLASADRTKWSWSSMWTVPSWNPAVSKFHVPILGILLLSRKALLCQIVMPIFLEFCFPNIWLRIAYACSFATEDVFTCKQEVSRSYLMLRRIRTDCCHRLSYGGCCMAKSLVWEWSSWSCLKRFILASPQFKGGTCASSVRYPVFILCISRSPAI